MTLAETVAGATSLSTRARELAAELRQHLAGIADYQRRGALHRVEMVLIDFANGVAHAEQALSPTVKEKLAS